MDCVTNVNIPTPIAEKCQGVYTSTDCIIIPEANATLDLPADSTQTEVNDALTAALIYKQQQIEALEAAPVPDGSETKVTAGTNVTVTGTGTIAAPYIINTTDSSPYKVYTATLTQNGTNPPTVNILQNTIGTITWAYGGIGYYYANSSSLFAANKTWTTAQASGTGDIVKFFRQTSSQLMLTVAELDGSGTDGALVSSSIEIRVYN